MLYSCNKIHQYIQKQTAFLSIFLSSSALTFCGIHVKIRVEYSERKRVVVGYVKKTCQMRQGIQNLRIHNVGFDRSRSTDRNDDPVYHRGSHQLDP